ncbi:thermonuclease family protein [Mycoplasma crocodyli]|uniref:Putative lipoprotein n=1 Tax=Mycoplasma crocodyli (strain ATCC 51981 / MP145) TaxID=512564 RepID=D5E6B4_MYCCM|nr:thermonuclease family protein [Mycoplasma crocodyli]ADE19959.1 putative lipoprotein [Mycoplasma crocodyli MP145]
MISKKLKLSLIAIPFVLSVPFIVASCAKNYTIEQKIQKGKEELDKVKFDEKSAYKFSDVDWSKVKYIEGELDKWADGDTPYLKNITAGDNEISRLFYKQNEAELKKGKKIRVLGIDTPEKALPGNIEIKPIELVWAQAASKFGEVTILPNQKVRVMTDGQPSYDRLVGSIYFGDKFEYEYSTEIVRAGYTLPNGSEALKATLDGEDLPSYYQSYGIVLAYKEAKKKQNGFWKIFNDEYDVTNNTSGIYISRQNNGWKIYSDKDFSDEGFTTIEQIIKANLRFEENKGKKISDFVYIPVNKR